MPLCFSVIRHHVYSVHASIALVLHCITVVYVSLYLLGMHLYVCVRLVCSPECLMPAVQTGNVIKVDDILNSIKNKLQKQNNQESIPKGTEYMYMCMCVCM